MVITFKRNLATLGTDLLQRERERERERGGGWQIILQMIDNMPMPV